MFKPVCPFRFASCPLVVLITCIALPTVGVRLLAQAPGVPIIRDRGEPFESLMEQAEMYRTNSGLLTIAAVMEQLDRKHCSLRLPKPATRKLEDTAIWRLSRASHVRVGWHYLCQKCDRWHQNLAGGYFVTRDGVIATCHHVIKPKEDHREGYLIAATESGELLPVVEVLASDHRTDAALIRAKVPRPIRPLPLNTAVTPGAAAWCYSDPVGRTSYFSKGMVNRFYIQERRDEEAIRMEVSTDWAPGSSGSAIVDDRGNAIGHVTEISSAGSPRSRGTDQPARGGTALIVFHSAVRAADVLSLVTNR